MEITEEKVRLIAILEIEKCRHDEKHEISLLHRKVNAILVISACGLIGFMAQVILLFATGQLRINSIAAAAGIP